jgi:hypothetical protein
LIAYNYVLMVLDEDLGGSPCNQMLDPAAMPRPIKSRVEP